MMPGTPIRQRTPGPTSVQDPGLQLRRAGHPDDAGIMTTRPAVSVARLLTALCLALVLSAVASEAGARVRPAQLATFDDMRPVIFGTFSGDPYDGNVDKTDALEQQIGRRIGIVNWFQNWSGDEWTKEVHPEIFAAVTGSGRLPMLTWMPSDGNARPANDQPEYRLQRIADGALDDFIAQFARDLRDLGTTVYVRPMHEMNGDWYPWGGMTNANTPREFRRAWRHMHDVFEREGATNVRWVWSPLAESVPNVRRNRLERYYPGRRYVDVLALDGYNWGSTRPDMGGYRSFREIFRRPYKRLRALGNQPIWLAEVGTAPEGGDKAEWVRGMFATAKRWNKLEAIVWFDQDKERDWRAAPNDAVAAAFRG